LWACCVSATQPAHNYSDKTVAELLELLENKDSTVRHCAASFLGERYRNPKAIVINGPIHKPNSPSPEFPIPPQVVPKLAEHLKTDPDLSVRMCAVFALRDLRFRTNTTPILVSGLDDKDGLIRIRTCTALIDISQEYSEPLTERVIPTLTQCLAPNGEIEDIWQAAYASEQLGSAGRPLIPAWSDSKSMNRPKYDTTQKERSLRLGTRTRRAGHNEVVGQLPAGKAGFRLPVCPGFSARPA
jgi:hypothetical protein